MTILPFGGPDAARAVATPVANHLDGGGILAYPTETVYGLGSRPIGQDVATLAQLKQRRPGKPFLLLVSSRRMAEDQGLEFTRCARTLSDHYWPGPLTLVLRGARDRLPDALRGPEGGIAVRWTSHEGVAMLISLLGHALTSTSANLPRSATASGADAIVHTFSRAIEDGRLLVLDGGVLENVPPSTIVDCTADRPRMIRDGAIPLEEIRMRFSSLAL